MMRTEKEASACWCPFVRATNGKQSSNAAVNTLRVMKDYPAEPADDHTHDGNCIGSQCMAWRWGEDAPLPDERKEQWPEDESDHETEPARPANMPASWEWVPLVLEGDKWADGGYWTEPEAEHIERNKAALADRRGYCGLAGSEA
ncbi:MAG TPA: hypothetical protein VLJ58_21675 [Ramlibacter sp.]|nr:hypothetical protein [Ramlibacter sp.]